MSKELNMVISSEKSYQDFDNMFVEVYPDFYKSLNEMAKLSKTDLRLASYIKMNHSNDEIAKISEYLSEQLKVNVIDYRSLT